MKKTAASKRATLPRGADYAKSYHKDWARLSESGRFDMKRLKEAMLLLIANDAPLGPEWNGKIILCLATGSGTASAILAGIFCWFTGLMTPACLAK